MKIVLYNMRTPSIQHVLVEGVPEATAHHVMQLFCGKGWEMNRRPNLHTFTTGSGTHESVMCLMLKKD